jgi:hypothetical protein
MIKCKAAFIESENTVTLNKKVLLEFPITDFPSVSHDINISP